MKCGWLSFRESRSGYGRCVVIRWCTSGGRLRRSAFGLVVLVLVLVLVGVVLLGCAGIGTIFGSFGVDVFSLREAIAIAADIWVLLGETAMMQRPISCVQDSSTPIPRYSDQNGFQPHPVDHGSIHFFGHANRRYICK